MSTDQSVTCPNCSRQVEPGFKFCDYCGTKLDAAPAPTSEISAPKPAPTPGKPDAPKDAPAEARKEKKPPLFERMQARRAEKRSEVAERKAAAESAADEPLPASTPPEAPEASPEEPAKSDTSEWQRPPDADPGPAPEKVESPAIPPVPSVGMRPAATTATPGTTPAATTPVPPSGPQTRFTSRPMTVEQLRENQGRIGIAGRLRWREGEAPPGPEDTQERTTQIPPPPPPPTSWRPVDREAAPPRSLLRSFLVFLLHLVVAFLAGAVLLAIAAIVASLTSDGAVTLLEIRGLPIFIAGATAIVVFSLLRTGPRNTGNRRAMVLSVLAGFVILVAAVVLAYRPSLMQDAQRELDGALGVFGPDVESDIERFTGDVDAWNNEVNNYRTDLRAILAIRASEQDAAKRDAAFDEFSVAASGVEAALDGVQKRMVSHADAVSQAPLREALQDLAAVYKDQLSGIRKLTRGVVSNEQELIAAGDTGFKDAATRAVEFFDEQVEPLLERAEIDPAPLEASVAELTE